MFVFTGFRQQNMLPAAGLMQLEATVLLSLTMAGGVRFSTITNGIVAFAFYAIAFVGGLVEQVGLMAGNAPARYIGTAISLLSPADALWRKATHTLLPPFITQVQVTPFSGGAVPSAAMVWWGVFFSFAALALAIRGFGKRSL